MIDTGSSRSFISPRLANTYYRDCIYFEPFEVVSTRALSRHNEVVYITLPSLFKCADKHKFYIYSVDDRYDGLIGSDLLTHLNAKVDIGNKVLLTETCKIPIVYTAPNRDIQQ